MIEAVTFVHTRIGLLTVSGIFPMKTEGGAKMIEIATFIRARSGDLTISGIFPEETDVLPELPTRRWRPLILPGIPVEIHSPARPT